TFEAKIRADQGFFAKWADGLRELVGAETNATKQYLQKLGEAQDAYIVASKKNETTEQEIANKRKEQQLEQQKADKQAGKVAEKLWFDLAKARQDAGKLIEKDAQDTTKILNAQLEAQLKGEQKEIAEKIKTASEWLAAYKEELGLEEKELESSTARKLKIL